MIDVSRPTTEIFAMGGCLGTEFKKGHCEVEPLAAAAAADWALTSAVIPGGIGDAGAVAKEESVEPANEL